MLEHGFLEFFILNLSNLDFQDLSIFSDPLGIIIILAIGFAAGLSIGVAGFGITPVLVPSLILIGGIPHLIVGTVLIVTVITKGFATVVHGKIHNINWTVVGYIFIPVIPSMIITSMIWTFVEENHGSEKLDLLVVFMLGLVLIAVTIYLVRELFKKTVMGNETHAILTKKSKTAMLLGGGIVSFITQITSAGAGPMFLPLLVRVLRSPKYSTGTLTIVGLLVAAVGSILHYNIGNVTPSLILLLVIGAIPGVLVGIKVGRNINPKNLSWIFVILSTGATIFLFAKGISMVLS